MQLMLELDEHGHVTVAVVISICVKPRVAQLTRVSGAGRQLSIHPDTQRRPSC